MMMEPKYTVVWLIANVKSCLFSSILQSVAVHSFTYSTYWVVVDVGVSYLTFFCLLLAIDSFAVNIMCGMTHYTTLHL